MVRGDMNWRSGTEPASAPTNMSASSWRRASARKSALSAGVGGLTAASRAVKSYMGRAARSRARWKARIARGVAPAAIAVASRSASRKAQPMPRPVSGSRFRSTITWNGLPFEVMFTVAW